MSGACSRRMERSIRGKVILAGALGAARKPRPPAAAFERAPDNAAPDWARDP